MPLTRLLPQEPDDTEKKLGETLADYRSQLENLWATFAYKEPNLLNINQNMVNGFITELSGIMGGILAQRNVSPIRKYLISVDAVVAHIKGARYELTLVWNSFGMTNTDKNVQARLGHYDKCQKFLEDAIKQFR